MPVTPQVAPIPTVPKAHQPDTVTASQKPSTPAMAVSNLFHMIRPADTSSSPIRHVTVGTHRYTPLIVQVTSTALTPEELAHPIPRIDRVNDLAHLSTRILVDHKAGQVRESCGHPVLDEAAAKAIKKWKFTPAQDGLFAVRSVVDLPIRFSLKSLG